MSVILLKNKMMHYEVLGRGKPLIFLHGWIGSWRYWFPSLQAASANYRAYAIDFWGFGDTTKENEDYSILQQSSLLDGFLEEMGIGRIALIAHGLGALVAMHFTINHPNLVDRLMIISYPMSQTGFDLRLRNDSPALLAETTLPHNPGNEPVLLEAGRTSPKALSGSFENLPVELLWGAWENLKIPCLLVNGQNDTLIPPPTADEIAKLPENYHGILFEESGHFPMLEESNKFNRLMADFLALKSGESPRALQLKEEWIRRFR
ncbi:MAG: alpha/beta hydrolase [Anaerolineae bacterium]|nr:alpha/beta hydrolase [Anaerolineae bacterium]